MSANTGMVSDGLEPTRAPSRIGNIDMERLEDFEVNPGRLEQGAAFMGSMDGLFEDGHEHALIEYGLGRRALGLDRYTEEEDNLIYSVEHLPLVHRPSRNKLQASSLIKADAKVYNEWHLFPAEARGQRRAGVGHPFSESEWNRIVVPVTRILRASHLFRIVEIR